MFVVAPFEGGPSIDILVSTLHGLALLLLHFLLELATLLAHQARALGKVRRLGGDCMRGHMWQYTSFVVKIPGARTPPAFNMVNLIMLAKKQQWAKVLRCFVHLSFFSKTHMHCQFIPCPLLQLPLPRVQQALGHYNQHWLLQHAILLQVEDQGDGLEGLSQAHVISQDAPQAVPRVVHQPVISGQLIGSQLCCQPPLADACTEGRLPPQKERL